jgi:hypothetical protein
MLNTKLSSFNDELFATFKKSIITFSSSYSQRAILALHRPIWWVPGRIALESGGKAHQIPKARVAVCTAEVFAFFREPAGRLLQALRH